MIATSDYYKAHILDKVNKWKAKIVIDFSDYNIDNTIAVSNTFDAEGSFPEQIADGIKTPSYKYFSWANFEWGCHLMGTDTNYEHGAISSQISGADKTFPENKPAFYGTTFYGTEPSSLYSTFTPKPIFSVTFLERQITDLEVVFDDKLNEFAEEFDVRIYQGTTLASTEVVTGNTGTTWTKTLSSAIDDVTRMDLVINKWSLAGTWARVLEFYTSLQKTYLEDDILSMSIVEESIAKRASTPIGNITSNSCEISLVNLDSQLDNDNEASPLQGNLIKNRRIMPYIGMDGDIDSVTGKQNYIEWGVYYSQQWTNDNYNMTAGCNGRDVIQLMDEAEFNESQFITEPADQNQNYTTTADFAAFTKFNTVAENDSLRFGGQPFVYESTAGTFYGGVIFEDTKVTSNGDTKVTSDGFTKISLSE